jgi:hypothetical protein
MVSRPNQSLQLTAVKFVVGVSVIVTLAAAELSRSVKDATQITIECRESLKYQRVGIERGETQIAA